MRGSAFGAALCAWPAALQASRDPCACREALRATLRERARGGATGGAGAGAGTQLPEDLFFEALCLARGLRWSEVCVGKTLDIMLELLEFERENPMCSMEQSFDKFRRLVSATQQVALTWRECGADPCSLLPCFVRVTAALLRQVLIVSCERPPWTVGLFNKEQVAALTEFVLQNHYRHFALHKHLTAENLDKLELELVA